MALFKSLKENFVSGLLLVLPFVAVLIVLKVLSDWGSIVVNPLVKETRLVQYTSNIEIVAQLIAAGVIVVILVVLGYVYTRSWGEGFRNFFGKFVNFVPLIGTVYLSVRQVASSIGSSDSRFKRLVMVEYPQDDIYSLGLLTSSAPEPLQKKDGETLYSVFFPNSPNPTGGRTVMVPESKVIEVDMSVQKGLKMMLTTGIAYEDEELPETFSDEG